MAIFREQKIQVAENDPKFKKREGWPKNLVSYKKKACIRGVFKHCKFLTIFAVFHGNFWKTNFWKTKI